MKEHAAVENHVADYCERFFEPGTAHHNPFNVENFSYHIYSGYLTPSFFHFSFSSFPSTFPTIAQPIWRHERKGFSLIELFLFPCTLSRSPFIFKSSLLYRLVVLWLNGSFCFCFFRFIRWASEKFHADFHAWKKLVTRWVELFKETLWSLLESFL